VNDHKIQDLGVKKCLYFLSIYVVKQYHMKSATSVFLIQKSA